MLINIGRGRPRRICARCSTLGNWQRVDWEGREREIEGGKGTDEISDGRLVGRGSRTDVRTRGRTDGGT